MTKRKRTKRKTKTPYQKTACYRVRMAVVDGFTALRSPKAGGYTRAKKALKRADAGMKACMREDNTFNQVSATRTRVSLLRERLK